MGKKTKVGKGRLDKYYHLAKEQGYRARSAFKLIQLNRKFNFLSNARVCIDLCAAPGGWLQVASKYMPMASMIIGVDLVPIRPIPNVITLTQDITTAACRRELKKHMSTWKADCVLNDGAPNVGAQYSRDAYVQNELVLWSLKLATEFLKPGGVFVSKVFRSQDYNSLMWVMQQFFEHVDATRPSASREASAEIFVVCRGYLAPKKIDPRLLEAEHVFKQIGGPSSTTEVNIFRQLEKQRRNRSGYDPENPTLYKELSASEFIMSEVPTQLLASYNKILLTGAENELYYRDADTNGELRHCMEDLRVLGKKEFRNLLKWRLLMRRRHHRELEEAEAADKKAKLAEERRAARGESGKTGEDGGEDDGDEDDEEDENLTEEQRVERALAQRQRAIHQREKKHEKKRRKKMREATRRAAMALSAEDMKELADQEGLFRLAEIRDPTVLKAVLSKESAKVADEIAEYDSDAEVLADAGNEEEIDYDDALEKTLDEMYDNYLQTAKHAPKRRPDSERHQRPEDRLAEIEEDVPEYTDSEDEERAADANPLMIGAEQLAGPEAVVDDAADSEMWWSKPVFSDLLGDDVEAFVTPDVGETPAPMSSSEDEGDSESESDMSSSSSEEEAHDAPVSQEWPTDSSDEEETADPRAEKRRRREEAEKDGFEVVPQEPLEESSDEYDEEKAARALALGQKMIDESGKISRAQLIDQTYHRYSFWTDDTLPRWFRDDEERHTIPQAPVTKEEVLEQKERFRAIDARPIRKVAEAKARRKLRAGDKLKQLKQQAAAILQSDTGDGQEKMVKLQRTYQRQMSRLRRKKQKMLVRKTLHNSKNKRASAPRGSKLVDPRLKSDLRGQKNAEARSKRKRK